MAPQPARERASRSPACPDCNPSGTLQPAALTTEGRALLVLRAVVYIALGVEVTLVLQGLTLWMTRACSWPWP